MIFSLDRHQLRHAAYMISQNDDSASVVPRAICGVLNNLPGYPRQKDAEWHDWISCPSANVAMIASRWSSLQPKIEYQAVNVHELYET